MLIILRVIRLTSPSIHLTGRSQAPGTKQALKKDTCTVTTQRAVHAQEREAQCSQSVAAVGRSERAVWATLEGFTEQVRFLQMGSRQKCIARGVKSRLQGKKNP